MAADKPQFEPGLLEQLYPDELGELDEAEHRALRDAAAQSAEEREELRDLNAMLGLIRAEDHSTPVRAAVHDSILDAARAHHAQNATGSTPIAAKPTDSRTSAAAQRAPRVPEAEPPRDRKPFWARIPIETGRQIALAGTVLFVAGIAFVLTRSQPAEQKFDAANSAVTQEVSFGEPSGLAQSPAAEPSSIAEPTEIAKADSLEAAREPQDSDEADLGGGEAEFALNTDYKAEARPEGVATGNSRSRSSKAAPSRSARSKPRAPAKKKAKSKPMAKPKASAPSKGADPFAALDDSVDSSSALSDREAAESKAAGAEALADAEEVVEAEKVAEEVAEAPAPSSADLGYAGRGGQATGSKQAKKTEPSTQSKDNTADTSQIDAIAESFASAHYDETGSRVDLLMADTSVSARDKARGLEFKARAQEASGDPSGALDTYERLKSSYADFKPTTVAAAIARLERTLNSKPMKRRRMQESAPSPSSMDSAQ